MGTNGIIGSHTIGRCGLVGVVVALMGEVYHWEWVSGFQNLKPGPVVLSLPSACNPDVELSPTF